MDGKAAVVEAEKTLCPAIEQQPGASDRLTSGAALR
jgi:hypothetical protein